MFRPGSPACFSYKRSVGNVLLFLNLLFCQKNCNGHVIQRKLKSTLLFRDLAVGDKVDNERAIRLNLASFTLNCALFYLTKI